jgi:hypothetical protein
LWNYALLEAGLTKNQISCVKRSQYGDDVLLSDRGQLRHIKSSIIKTSEQLGMPMTFDAWGKRAFNKDGSTDPTVTFLKRSFAIHKGKHIVAKYEPDRVIAKWLTATRNIKSHAESVDRSFSFALLCGGNRKLYNRIMESLRSTATAGKVERDYLRLNYDDMMNLFYVDKNEVHNPPEPISLPHLPEWQQNELFNTEGLDPIRHRSAGAALYISHRRPRNATAKRSYTRKLTALSRFERQVQPKQVTLTDLFSQPAYNPHLVSLLFSKSPTPPTLSPFPNTSSAHLALRFGIKDVIEDEVVPPLLIFDGTSYVDSTLDFDPKFNRFGSKDWMKRQPSSKTKTLRPGKLFVDYLEGMLPEHITSLFDQLINHFDNHTPFYNKSPVPCDCNWLTENGDKTVNTFPCIEFYKQDVINNKLGPFPGYFKNGTIKIKNDLDVYHNLIQTKLHFPNLDKWFNAHNILINKIKDVDCHGTFSTNSIIRLRGGDSTSTESHKKGPQGGNIFCLCGFTAYTPEDTIHFFLREEGCQAVIDVNKHIVPEEKGKSSISPMYWSYRLNTGAPLSTTTHAVCLEK